jgi:hypothetical protein
MSQNKDDELNALLARLDEETRRRWAEHLATIDAEVEEKGPAALREHLDAALRHLLAIGWTLHRCYAEEEAKAVLRPIGEAAAAVDFVRGALDTISKKPEWSQ